MPARPNTNPIKPYPQTFVGIDPGVHGGIAVLVDGEKSYNSRIRLVSMPPTELDLCNYINHLPPVGIVALVEWIHPAIQGIGKSQQSKLYGNYMSIRMALTAAGIPFETIQAKKWQAALGIEKRKPNEKQAAWKNRLRAKAQQLYPQEKITADTADALLIAEYCRRISR